MVRTKTRMLAQLSNIQALAVIKKRNKFIKILNTRGLKIVFDLQNHIRKKFVNEKTKQTKLVNCFLRH